MLWANVHGLWVVGLGVVFLYGLFTLAGRTPMAAPEARRWMAAAFVGCLFAVMLTPAGPAGILYPLRYIDSGDWGLANIHEWQSPDFHSVAHLGLLALIVTLLAVGLWNGTPGWMGVLAMGGRGAEPRQPAQRAAAGGVGGPGDRHVAGGPLARPADAAPGAGNDRSGRGGSWRWPPPWWWSWAAPSSSCPRRRRSHLEESITHVFPVASLDIVLEQNPNARVLAEYGWGGYVIYAGYDHGARVFVDGRNDMYDQSILEDYSAIRSADPGWQELLDSYQVDAMIWPPDVVLTRGLLDQPMPDGTTWCEAYRDDTQVLYLPECPASP